MSIHPDDLDSRWFALGNQAKLLIGANTGLQSMLDFLWQYDASFTNFSDRVQKFSDFQRFRLEAREYHRMQYSCLVEIDRHLKKKAKGLDKFASRMAERELEEAAINLLGGPTDRGFKEYDRIYDYLLDTYDIDPSGVVMLAWIAYYEAGFRLYCSAYEAWRLALMDYNSYNKTDHFHVSKWEWRKGYIDLVYGNIKGNTEYSISVRGTLQAFAFGGLQNYELKTDLGGTSLCNLFEENQFLELWGFLNEHYSKEFYPLSLQANEKLLKSKTIIMPPLLNRILADVVRSRPLTISYSAMTSFNMPIQQMSASYWQTGELSGIIKMFPNEMDYMASNYFNGSSVILGDQGGGKTTMETAIDYCSVEKQDCTVFFPMSPPLNWPELACMPSMDMPGNGVYDFLVKTLHVRPRGIPVLMLNIVDSLDRLKTVPLTKYDRIIQYRKKTEFEFDLDKIFDELKFIASDYGKKKACGIIAVRNLRDTVIDEKSDIVESDVYNAARFFLSFQKWRPENMDKKVRITWDEVRDLNQISTKGQAKLAFCNKNLLSATRNQQTPIDYATDKIRDTTMEVREMAQNTIFGRLPKQSQEGKSPIDILLGGLDVEEWQVNTIKTLSSNGFLSPKYHLMVWFDKAKPKSLELISPLPAPFQAQILPNVTNKEVKKFYVKMLEKAGNQKEADDFLVPLSKFESKGWLWKAEGEEKTEEKEQEPTFA